MSKTVWVLSILCFISHIARSASTTNTATPDTSVSTTNATTPDYSTNNNTVTSSNPSTTNATDQTNNPAQSTTQPSAAPQLYTIDQIAVVIMNEKGTKLLTKSETERPDLFGRPQTVENMTFEPLVELKAEQLNIKTDKEAIDKYLNSIQKDNNLTLQQLEDIFAQSGYTLEEGRRELAKLQTIRTVLSIYVPSDVIVPKKLITQYYQDNPRIVEANYLIEYALIPFSSLSKQDQFKEITDHIASSPTDSFIEWNEPFWISKNKLAENKYFITDLSIGEISTPVQTEIGFEVYRLRDKTPERLKTLEERYTKIANKLRMPYYMDLLEEFKKNLFAESSIQYFDLIP